MKTKLGKRKKAACSPKRSKQMIELLNLWSNLQHYFQLKLFLNTYSEWNNFQRLT